MFKIQIGKYYKWVGPANFSSNWSSQMNAWKDGEIRKCLFIDERSGRMSICFENIRDRGSEYYVLGREKYGWDYSHLISEKYFKEILSVQEEFDV